MDSPSIWTAVRLLQLGAPLLLLLATFAIGRAIEGAHLRSLCRREQELRALLVTNLSAPPPGLLGREPLLCIGSVVVGTDYFKQIGAALKSLVGGRLRTIECVLERARREALVRMLEQARAHGAALVCNVRIETAAIGRGAPSDRRGSAMAEVVAYGTALRHAGGGAMPYR